MRENGVPLEQFVSETLTAIVAGVVSAAKAVAERGGSVNPPTLAPDRWPGPWNSAQGVGTQFVEFDVAVTASAGTATTGGAGIAIGPLVLGTTGKSSDQQQSVSHIKFHVPLMLPPSGPKLERGTRPERAISDYNRM